MRLQDKRLFTALNFDDADEALQDGDMRDALNIRVGITESGDDGIVENTKGNISLFSELGFSLPVGINKCIGTCTDDQYSRLIYFNYNSNGHHGIYAYNNDTNTIDTVMVTPVFGWLSNTKINSSDILQNLLTWVESDNRPRSINVAKAIAGDYGATIIEELITDAKVVPMFPPVVSSTITFSDDYIKSLRSFQFIYRYVFVNGEKSAFSTVSRLIVTGYNGEHINKITLNVSTCELFTKTELRNIVSYVEFASRELYTFNFNQFLRITTADLVTSAGIVDYFDTESKTAIDTDITDLAFYEVPNKAGSVAYQNDRKFYADCTEGYDAFQLVLSDINTQVIPASGGIPYLSDCNTHIYSRYLKPDSEYSYAVEWMDKFGRKSGASTKDALTIKTATQVSNDYKANVLQFGANLSNTANYPSYAEKIEIIRSENKTVSWFAQGRVNNILYCTGYDASNNPVYIKANPGPGNENASDGGTLELHIDISNWSLYGTNIPYTFTDGDRITFFTLGGSADYSGSLSLKGLKIKSLRGSLLIVDYPQIGRTNLNHAMLSVTTVDTHSIPDIFNLVLSRFIVGDNGVALYSRFQQAETGSGTGTWPDYPFAFTNIARIPNFPTITNNLYGVSMIYGSPVDASSIEIYIVGSGGFFIKQGSYNPKANTFGSWNTIATGTTSDINSIESSFNNHNKADLIMVGNGGLILKYNRAGSSITVQASGTTENLNYVYRETTSSNLIAVGNNGTILRTTNGGTTWTKISIINCQNLNGVYFSGNYAIAVGDEGLLLLSSDAGLTWSIAPGISTKYNLNSVEGDGAANNRVYIAGENGYFAQYSMSGPAFIAEYNPSTTKNINFFQSYASEAGVRFDQGIMVGDFDLLVDVDVPSLEFQDYDTTVAAIYGSLLLNYKAKIEVYTPRNAPSPIVYYEYGDAYKVGTDYTFNKGLDDDGDVFLIKKDFQGKANNTAWVARGELIFSMTPNSSNTTNAGVSNQITVAWDKDLGRPNVVLLYPEVQVRRNIVRWSDKFIQNSQVNGLSNFQPLNYEPVPNEFGIIVKITPLESVMLINCEKESATAYIDISLITGSSGQQQVGLSSKVINNIRKLAGGFGCTNPESIVKYLEHVYFYSSNKVNYCRYNNSNGVFPISEYKARTYFFHKNPLLVVSGFEPKFKNTLVTITDKVPSGDLQVIKTTGVGASPYFPTYDPVNKRMWIGNSGSNTISVIDVLTNEVVKTVTVQTGPRNPTYDPDTQRMYCSCTSGSVVVVRCSDYAILKTIAAGNGTRPGVYDPVNHRMYVPNGTDGTVVVISTSSNTIIATIGSITDPSAPIYDPVYARVYFGAASGSNITVISTASNAVVQTIAGTGTPNNGCYDPVSKQMFFGNGSGTTTVSVVDTTDYSYSTITVGNTPFDTIYFPEIARVVVSNYVSGTASIINPSTNFVENVITTGTGPRGAAYDPVNRFLLIPNQTGGTVSIFDASNNYTLISTVVVGSTPALYPLFISGKFYVSNLGSATVNVISSLGNSETIAFQEGNNRWISKFSFTPEKYGYVKTNMFSFVDGVLWKHNANSTYNNFYGVQYSSKVKPVFNREPSAQKNFNCISLESDEVWTASEITTAQGQTSILLSCHFEQINNEWWADVLQDINTANMASGDALFNGDYMQSNVLTVNLENTSLEAVKLRFANLYSSINERTNK